MELLRRQKRSLNNELKDIAAEAHFRSKYSESPKHESRKRNNFDPETRKIILSRFKDANVSKMISLRPKTINLDTSKQVPPWMSSGYIK